MEFDGWTMATSVAVSSLIIVMIGYMLGGTTHSPFLALFGIGKTKTVVRGFVEPGYESVKEVFQKIIDDGMEDKAQVSAFVDGKLVINLVGLVDSERHEHEESGHAYDHDSLQNIFSSTKAITSIVVSMLVDRKLLKYESPIAEVWPEFAQEGKHEITVEDLMKHESGMDKFSFSLSADDLHRDNIKRNASGAKIEKARSRRTHPKVDKSLPPERKYHFLTRDIIVNEIVRRVDSKQRTIGEFVRDEIAGPLGLGTQLTLGCETVELEHKVFPLVEARQVWIFSQLLSVFQRRVSAISCMVALFMQNSVLGYQLVRLIMGPSYGKPPVVLGHEDHESGHLHLADAFNAKKMRAAEIPSANSHASAFALAKVASVMANNGEAHGVRLLRPETYAHAISNPTHKRDNAIMANTTFVKGGWAIFGNEFAFGENRKDFIGWFGIGGSVCQWHNELKIGFGYTNTLISVQLGNENGSLLQKEIVTCVRKLQEK